MPADRPRTREGRWSAHPRYVARGADHKGDDVSADGDRIDALETHLAFQGDTIRQLNDALVAQQSRIDRLEAEFERVIATVQRAASDAPGPPADERPPHY